MLIKGAGYQKDITILNFYVPDNIESKIHKIK